MKKMFTILQTHVNRIVSMITIAVMGFSPQLANAQTTNMAPYCNLAAGNQQGPCTSNLGFRLNRVRLANLDFWEPTCNTSVTSNNRFFAPPAAERAILTPGTNYTITVATGQAGTGNYAHAVGVWIDWDNSFTYDASERIINTINSTDNGTRQSNGTVIDNWERHLSIPCGAKAGTYRMRVAMAYWGDLANACTTPQNYGEAWDFEVTVLPTPPVAKPDFTFPSSVFIGTPLIFVNTTTNLNSNFSWDLDLDGTDATSINFPHVFTTSGTRFMKLKITGCGVADSVIKAVNVMNPTTVPTPDFFANRTIVEEYDELILTDISSDGPSDWDWLIENPIGDPSGDFTHTTLTGTRLGIGNRSNKMLFVMEGMGYFDVTLTAINSVGNKSRKKAAYIEIVPYSIFRLGAGLKETQLGKGTIHSKYGPDQLYGDDANGDPDDCWLRIKPCGAITITLRIERLMLGNSLHKLRVFDGGNAAFGKALHPSDGFSKDNTPSVPFEIVATSGQMYVEFDGFALGGRDSGIIAYFETDYGVTGPPMPSIGLGTGLPVAYSQALTEVRSTSQNIFGLPDYSWFVDGMPVSGANIIGEGDAFWHTFPTAGTYQVCMELTSCAGDASFCDNITVENPTGPTDLDFVSNNVRPDAFQPIIVTPETNKANRFLWEIDPPGKFNFQVPFNASSRELRGAFTEAGAYTITLTAWSTFDSSLTSTTLTKQDYIIVVDYCTPGVQIVSGDIGLRNVRINNSANQTVFSQTTTTGLLGYENFTGPSANRIPLHVGGTYNISLSRASNSDATSHAVFIDYNGDGVFDASERVLRVINTPSNTTSGSFKVPNVEDVFTGAPVRMRVVTAFKGNEPTACGPLTVGEYEDYLVDILTITDAPVITIFGSGSMSIEQGTLGSFVDPGAFAMDVIEGDISNLIQVDTDLDESTVGTYTMTYTVRNASGIEATPRTRIIEVVPDNTPPVLTILGNNPDTIEVFSGAYNDLGVTAIDAVDGNITANVVVDSDVNEDVLGSYKIVYTITDAANNTSSITRNVVVVDTEAPVIIVIGSEKIELGSFWYDQTSVTDNYWSVNQITFTKEYGFNGPVRWDVKGNYSVKYVAIDGSGNRSELTRNYEVDDFTAPVIRLNTSDTVIHDVATNYNPTTPTITDNNYPANTLQVERTTNLNVNQIGLYTETYRATDGSGNTSTRVRYIRVIDRFAPVITAPSVCSKVGFDFNSLATISVKDNYYPVDVLMDLIIVKHSTVNPFLQGDYTAIYQVTDPSGNTSAAVTQQVKISENCDLITNVNDVNVSDMVKVYPNPSSGLFNVDLSKLAGTSNSVKVMDNVGNLVMTVDLSTIVDGNFVLDLSSMASGVYMLNIQGAEHNVVVRLVVVK